jgi:hypothetical protein
MKRRHVSLMGWKVVSITFAEWDELATPDRRRAFLAQAVSDAVDDDVLAGLGPTQY